jgi:YVTN family beta-propeller protein
MFWERMQFSGLPRRALVHRIALVLMLFPIGTGCGDTFRPVAVPIPGPAPDPQNFHFTIVASQNAPGNPGSGMQIDVSGDTNVGAVPAGSRGCPNNLCVPGEGPVHAAILSLGANRVYLANGTDDTVTTFSPAGPSGAIGTPTTITLPSGSNPVFHSNPVFLHTTEPGTMYVANNGVLPGTSSICPGTSTVAAISTATEVVTNFICVGLQPTVLAETPDGRKLYSVNQGSASITAINTVDKSVNATISGFNGLVWAVASLDSTQLYILDQTGISVMDTTSDTLVPASSVSLAAGSNFMFLDRHLNRLYVTNPTTGSLTILDATANPLKLLPNNIALPSAVAMVTALNDGTRAYVASYQVGACSPPLNPADTCVSSQVAVIRTSDNTLSKTIALGSRDLTTSGLLQSKAVCDDAAARGRFPVSIASSMDSSKVYVANCYAGSTSVIRTSDDTCVINPVANQCADINSPVSAYPSAPGQPLPPPPPQNPLWVVAGP